MAIRFSGFAGDERINCGSDASLDNITQKTLTAWIDIDNYGSSDEGLIVMKADSSLENGWYFGVKGSGGPPPRNNLRFGQFFTGAQEWRSPADSILLNVSYHVAIVYDRSSDTNDPIIYINGVSVTVTQTDSSTGSAASDAAQDVLIGNNPSPFNMDFQGIISDLRIYDRLLSADEIATIYQTRGVDGIVDGLVSRWPQNEGPEGGVVSGTDVVKDVAVNRNDGTPTNDPEYDAGVVRSRRRVA